MRRFIFIVWWVLWIGLVPTVQATDRFVAPNGEDTGQCLAGAPCRSIVYGISQMVDGDTLILADGTYSTGFSSGLGGCAQTGSAHIALNAGNSCPTQGCTIRAANVTDPPSVVLNGSRMGVYAVEADGWSIEGLEFRTEFGVYACRLSDLELRDLVVNATPTAGGQPKHFFARIDRLTMERTETQLSGRPCDLVEGTIFRGMTVQFSNDFVFQDSYLGHLDQLITMAGVDTATIRRNHFQHWTNHGLIMNQGARNILVENNVLGGSTKAGCPTHPTVGPRGIDAYEVDGLVVRNNTFVGHGYTPRSAAISYFQFENTNAGCVLAPDEPGFCEFDTTTVCTDNDIPQIPGIPNSESSSECPPRDDGLPWSPNQRCSAHCELVDVKFYNNIVHDLRGGSEAGTRYIDWEAKGTWATSTNLRFDGNYYSGGVERWLCGGGFGDKRSLAEWRATQCEGGPNPDLHSIVGVCSIAGTPCGVDVDCGEGDSCLRTPPSFVDYANEDYRPSGAGAPQVDSGQAGVDVDGVARCASEDFFGNPRCDGECDIGAFELAPVDLDADGVGCDNCPLDFNPKQEDVDGDGTGDACDACGLDPGNDEDADGVCGDVDNCPQVANAGQGDVDTDGTGDLCDDEDGDGVLDIYETGTGVYNGPTDTGTVAGDPDSDRDGFLDGDEVSEGFDPNDRGSAPGGVPFSSAQGVAQNVDGARGLSSGDLDGDGDLDVISASSDDGAVAWYANTDGAGTFGPRRLIALVAAGEQSAVVSDIDGDGDLDVVSASSGDGAVAWYANTDGQGSFGPRRVIGTGIAGARSVFAADFDGDGDPDVAVASSGNDTVAWYANTDGAGNFGSAQPITTNASEAHSVFAADLDGDGDMDVLTASSGDDTVAWYANTDGAGTFTLAERITETATQVSSAVAADVDGDGDQDVMTASPGNDTVAWHANDGNGVFGSAEIISDSALGASSAFAGDIDGDGDADVMTASSGDDTVAWYENTLGNGFAWAVRTVDGASNGAATALAADVDGDGDPDLLAAASVADDIKWYVNRSLHRNASYPLSGDVSTTALGARSSHAGDIDGDGRLDVVSASAIDDRIAWYRNSVVGWIEQTITDTADVATAVTSGDVDGDGRRDVIYAAAFLDRVGWYRNVNGDGSFWQSRIASDAVSLIAAVTAADIDMDGDLDLATAGSGDDTLRWHENLDGLGMQWSDHVVDAGLPGCSAVVAADMDADGDPDLVATAPGHAGVRWFENRVEDALGWVERSISNTTLLASAVAVADLDGDGDPDVAAASAADGTIEWHENTSGDATAWTDHPVGGSAGFVRSIRIADADADGDGDLFVASAADDTVAWFENTAGDGSTWTRRVINSLAEMAASVFVADLDGDGAPDVLSASSGDDRVTWYPNLGGQVRLTTEDTAPLAVAEGSGVVPLAIELRHNGRAGDSAAELSALRLALDEEIGDPLTSAEANALVATLEIWADSDDSGTLDPLTDSLLREVMPLALVGGELEVDFPAPDPALEVDAGETRRYFVALVLTPDAASQNPSRLAVSHLTPLAVVRDADSSIRVEAEASDPFSSRIITAVDDDDLDGFGEDGNLSGLEGDARCTGGATADCDDNCPGLANDQADADADGVGDACDGCPADDAKITPGLCGCGFTEIDCFPVYQDDFESYAIGSEPPGWVQSGADNSLIAFPPGGGPFKVLEVDGNRVLASTSTDPHLHAHYLDQTWTGYEVTGRMRLDDALSDMGITFASQYLDEDVYYRLRRFTASATYQIIPRGDNISLSGDIDSGVNPAPGLWYRFRIQFEPLEDANQIRANVWQDGTNEPAGWQINATDSNPLRPTGGALGIWSKTVSPVFWDDLDVGPLPNPDLCPDDPGKTGPGQCGCGRPDRDRDGDGAADCVDACPDDESKVDPGTCGCDVPDTDSDGDGVDGCIDDCPSDPAKVTPGICGCGATDALADSDGDGTIDCLDRCPLELDDQTDADGDGVGDACDDCPEDPNKSAPGICGCGVSEIDTDLDGTPDCVDQCPSDPDKIAPGQCGCGTSDGDTDGDGFIDCQDNCPALPNDQADADGDGTGDACDGCPLDSGKVAPGVCGCGISDLDTDNDQVADCVDGCPANPSKIEPGICGCAVADTDSDGDLVVDCQDNCPLVANDQADGDSDGAGDACDECPLDPNKILAGQCGCGMPESACADPWVEDFSAYEPGTVPDHWVDTGPFNSLDPLLPENALFRVTALDGDRVLSTSSPETNIHSHYLEPGNEEFGSFELTGRMRIDEPSAGIGVTFVSQYPQEDVYYRLRRFRTNAFHLTPHGENIAISGDLDTGVIPQMGVWYRFRVRVVDEVSQTRIQARVWIDCSSEPSAWQADAIDTHPLRPRSGTIGVWSFLAGDRAWDDLALRPIDPQDTCAGICGCDVVEQDLDGDCTVDCLDGCLDADGDGYGEPGGLADHCLAADCDDTDPAVHPGAPELTCDGIDNDCDAGTPDNLDTDADGFGCGADCDDADPDVNPGAPELTCDGRDNDCNPATPDAVDADVDGQDCSLDCDDQNPAVQAAPGEARELLIGPQKTLLTWSAPTTAGGDEAGLVYDLLRSTGPTGFDQFAVCLAADGGILQAVDAGSPPPGFLWTYLVRAQNDCPEGEGSLGTGEGGEERTGRSCP